MHAPDINNAAEVSAALADGWLPPGSMFVDGYPSRVLVIPDKLLQRRTRGSFVILAYFDEVRTFGGKVVKSRNVR